MSPVSTTKEAKSLISTLKPSRAVAFIKFPHFTIQFNSIQKFKNPKTQKFKNSKTQIFKNSKTKKFKNLKIQKFKNQKIQKFKNSNFQKFKNSKTKNSKTKKFKNQEIQKLENSKIQKPKNSKTRKSKNPTKKFKKQNFKKIQKLKYSKIQKNKNSKIQKYQNIRKSENCVQRPCFDPFCLKMLTGLIARIVADALTDIVRDGSIDCPLDNLFIGHFIQIKTLIKIVIRFELRIIRRNWKSCIKVLLVALWSGHAPSGSAHPSANNWP